MLGGSARQSLRQLSYSKAWKIGRHHCGLGVPLSTGQTFSLARATRVPRAGRPRGTRVSRAGLRIFGNLVARPQDPWGGAYRRVRCTGAKKSVPSIRRKRRRFGTLRSWRSDRPVRHGRRLSPPTVKASPAELDRTVRSVHGSVQAQNMAGLWGLCERWGRARQRNRQIDRCRGGNFS